MSLSGRPNHALGPAAGSTKLEGSEDGVATGVNATSGGGRVIPSLGREEGMKLMRGGDWPDENEGASGAEAVSSSW